jgi:hypothetical protein
MVIDNSRFFFNRVEEKISFTKIPKKIECRHLSEGKERLNMCEKER